MVTKTISLSDESYLNLLEYANGDNFSRCVQKMIKLGFAYSALLEEQKKSKGT